MTDRNSVTNTASDFFARIFPFSAILASALIYAHLLSSVSGWAAVMLPPLVSMTALVALVYIIWRGNKNEKDRTDTLIFAFLMILGLFRIIPGIDTTDSGFALSKAWNFVLGFREPALDFMWGSSWFNSLWLKLIGSPSLLWARLGYAIITGLTVFLIYGICRSFFQLSRTIWILLALASWCLTTVQLTVPNYNNIPVFFIALGSRFFFKAYSLNSQDWKSKWLFLISGILIGWTVHCRLPYLFYSSLPVFLFLYSRNKSEVRKKVFIATFSGGILIGIGIGFLILLTMGQMKVYFIQNMSFLMSSSASSHKETELHSISNLLLLTIKQFIHVGMALFFLIAGDLSGKKLKNPRLKKIFTIIFCGLFLLIMLMKNGDPRSFKIPKYEVLALISYLFYRYAFSHAEKKDFEVKVLLILFSLFTGLMTALGSDMGFITIFNSGGLVFPLMIAGALFFESQLNISIGERRFLLTCGLLSLALTAFAVFPFSYRDENWYKMPEAATSVPLRGTVTGRSRAEALDSLLKEAELRKIGPQSRVLVLNSAPLLYFLMNTPFYTVNDWGPWLFLNPVSELQKLIDSDESWDLVVIAEKAQRDGYWPETQSAAGMAIAQYQWSKQWIASMSYSVLYKNGSYTLYGK